jgi:hypothetical protein
MNFKNKNTNIVIEVTVQNNSTERPLYVSITGTTVGTTDNLTQEIKKGDEDYEAGTVVTIDAGTESKLNSVTFQIILSIADKNHSINNASYNYSVNLNNDSTSEEESADPIYYEQDGTYYAKTTSLAGTEVVWKCYGFTNDTTVSDYSATSGTYGIFVQETYVTEHIFDSTTEVYMNSSIRQYLTDETESGYKNLVMSDSDYKQIVERTGGEDMDGATDKLWLLSHDEYSTFSIGNFGYNMWERTKGSQPYTASAWAYTTGGGQQRMGVYRSYAVRAVFLLKI